MSQPTLLDALRERVLLGDGAMGTQVQNAGLESGGCGEAWNLDHPERVLMIQRRYVEAGSDVLLSHSFGACRIMLNRHGEGERTAEINRAAVRVARQALGERGYVLGDIGPFGGLMEPYGDVAPADVERVFQEQARALVEGGADGIINMAIAARIVARYRAACGLPVMVQPNAGQPVLENMKVVYNETPEEMAAGLPGLLAAGPRIVGACCGSTPEHIRRFRQILDQAQPARGAR